MKSIVSHELLFDYFAGRVTALQRKLIADWLRDPANEEAFYQCLDEWERRKPQYLANLSDALPTYQAFLAGEQPAVEPTVTSGTPVRTIRRNQFPWMLAASVVLVLVVGGWFVRDTLLYRTVSTGYGKTQTLRLDDGSTVVLNANSSLQIPRAVFTQFGFGRRSRHVHLTGEANFNVAHTPDDQRFVVHTDKGLDVVVLGTEFTVLARPRETKVVLSRGKVLVNYPTTAQRVAQVTLKPGELVTLDGQGRMSRATTRRPKDFAAWQHHQFIFNNTSLREIGQLLTETYGIRVEINSDGLARQTLTGSFHAETADELLQAISEVLGINIVRHNEQVVLTDNNA